MTATMQKTGMWVMGALLALGMGLMLPMSSAHAAAGDINANSLKTIQEESGLGEQDLQVTIGSLIRTILGFLGILAILLILWAGFLWMTASGNEDQVGKAKGILISALIGLIIILSAYAITTFVLKEIGSATDTTFEGI